MNKQKSSIHDHRGQKNWKLPLNVQAHVPAAALEWAETFEVPYGSEVPGSFDVERTRVPAEDLWSSKNYPKEQSWWRVPMSAWRRHGSVTDTWKPPDARQFLTTTQNMYEDDAAQTISEYSI
jgi:hypothetical protein